MANRPDLYHCDNTDYSGGGGGGGALIIRMVRHLNLIISKVTLLGVLFSALLISLCATLNL